MSESLGAPRVVVVGGLNMDLVFGAPRRPDRGETLAGSAFGMFVGGKGANQAVAAARAGAQVQMVGRVGSDSFGQDILGALEAEGIGLRHVVRDPQDGTGVAGIVVEEDGANSIVVIPRANARLSEADVRKAHGTIAAASVLLVQLEVSVEASLSAARLARRAGVPVILNPAPARELGDAVYQSVDVLTPNEVETHFLTGIAPTTSDAAREAALVLQRRGVKTVLLTLGDRGALLADDAAPPVDVAPFAVDAVDTTAAGDAFCGALAFAMAEGRPMVECARFACAAGALACTVLGAGPSLPTRQRIEALLGA